MRGRLTATARRSAPIGACALLCVLLANCSSGVDPRYGVSPSPRVVADGDPVPKGGGAYRVGTPYTVAGRTYVPEENPHYQATASPPGTATISTAAAPRTAKSSISTAFGGASDAAVAELCAGDQSLERPLAHRARQRPRAVSRQPHHRRLHESAAQLLVFRASGTAWVRVEYVGRAPIEGSDDRILAATLRQDEPAPAPGSVKLAATRIVPAGSTASVGRNTHFASASANDAETAGTRPLSYAPGPGGRDGTDQFLNGRGLY